MIKLAFLSVDNEFQCKSISNCWKLNFTFTFSNEIVSRYVIINVMFCNVMLTRTSLPSPSPY